MAIYGYEPTLHKAFYASCVRLSQECSELILFTNARVFFYKERAEKLKRAGVTFVIVKFFSPEESLHDEHSGVAGSFMQAVEAVRNLRSAGIKVRISFAGNHATLNNKVVYNNLLRLGYKLTNTVPFLTEYKSGKISFQPVTQRNDMAHPAQSRYDVIDFNTGDRPSKWINSMFPMIHILTGPKCNIKCTYCNVYGGDLENQTLFSKDYIIDLLDHAKTTSYGNTMSTIDFIGGEPTLHPELPQLISHAKTAGFTSVSICTNGLKLYQEGYLEKLIASGLTGIRYSFHSHLQEKAGSLAARKSSGRIYIEVALNLLKQTTLEIFFLPHYVI